MDCSPEYVENYYSDEEESICVPPEQYYGDDGSLNMEKMFIQKSTQENLVENELKSLENISPNVITESGILTDISVDQRMPVAVDLVGIKQKHIRLKRLFLTKKHWQRKLNLQEQKEIEHQDFIENRIENVVPTMLKELDETKRINSILTKEIETIEFDIIEENKSMESKIKSVEILNGLYQEHKERMIKEIQDLQTKVEFYLIELIEEQFQLQTEMKKWWRFFSKSKIRREIQKIEKLRSSVEFMANKLQMEVEYLQQFKLSTK